MIKLLKNFIKKITLKYIKDYGDSKVKLEEAQKEASKIISYHDSFGSFYKDLSPLNSANAQIMVHKRFLALIEGMEDAKSIAIASHFFYLYSMIASTPNNHIKISKDGMFLPDNFYEKIWRFDQTVVQNIREKYNISTRSIVETLAMAPYSYGLGCLPTGIVEQIAGKTIIDAGAYSGETAFIFVDDFKPALAYSFEPDYESFTDLCESIKLNKKEAIIVPYQMALSDKDGTLVLNAPQNDPRSSSIINLSHHTKNDTLQKYEVKAQTLDNFMEEHPKAPAVGFIKADVEGAAFSLIKGALNTIKKDRPIMVLAIYHCTEEFFDIKPFIENLNLGYKFMIRKPAIKSPLHETILIAYCEK